MRTYSPKRDDIENKWYLIDAEGKILGRLASETSRLLQGKHRPKYSPHMNFGDHVIIVNAEKVRISGKKPIQKVYRHHTGWPGGLRTQVYRDVQREFPERIIHMAVKGMLPRNRIGRTMAKKLRVYAGPNHPHEAQKPEEIKLD
jgi:large subunit ribosomal protein L13